MSKKNGKPTYPCAFVADGYTRTVFVEGVEYVHPPCEFSYRPFRGPERGDIFSTVYATKGAKAGEVEEIFAQRIKSWNLESEPGVISEITAESLASLDGVLFSKILDVVMGVAAPDSDSVNGEKSDLAIEGDDLGN